MNGCAVCGGEGFLVEERDGRSYARPCACRAEARQTHQRDGIGIPPRYRHCTLGGYHPESQEQKAAREACRRFAESFPACDKGLLLVGPVGTGKTHLAAGILRDLCERGIFGMFVDLNELYRALQGTYRPGTDQGELEILAPVLDAPVVVLDDVGQRYDSEWMQDVLGYIVNGRYIRGRFVIATTNLQDVPAAGLPSLEDRIGARTRSRLSEMCMAVQVPGRDYRRSA